MPTSESILADRIDYMKSFPDNFFNLAVVDPEYGLNATRMQIGQNLNRNDGWHREESTAVKVRKGRLNSGGGKLKDRVLNSSDIDWDDKIPGPEFFEQLFRVSINQVIFGGNYFPLPPTRCIYGWIKCQPWENFSQWEMAWTSFDKPAMYYKYSNTGGANSEKKIHPTQKPISIYRDINRRLANLGDKILDTGSGSQSSRIASWIDGLDYWSCENKEQYFLDGNKRFKKHQSKLSLF